MINRAYLEDHIRHMRELVAGYNGAIEFATMLLGQLEPQEQPGDGLSIGEFAEMVGGEGATAEIMENGQS